MNRDYRGRYGQKADTAKPVWRPANHPKFNSKSEMKNVSIGFTWSKIERYSQMSKFNFRTMKSIEMFHLNDIQPQAGSIDANIFPKLPLLMDKPSTAKIIRLIRTKINIHIVPFCWPRKPLKTFFKLWNSKFPHSKKNILFQ